MLGSDAGQIVQLRRQGGHGVAQRQRQEVLGVAPPRALVQRLALQPDAHEPAAMHGQGHRGRRDVGRSRRGAWGKRRATPCAGRLACAVERIDELADYALADTKSLGTQCVSKAFVWNLVERRRLYLQNPKGLIFPVFGWQEVEKLLPNLLPVMIAAKSQRVSRVDKWAESCSSMFKTKALSSTDKLVSTLAILCPCSLGLGLASSRRSLTHRRRSLPKQQACQR